MNQKGFSLIELLCAMAIGLIIITVVVEVFIDFKKTHSIEKALAEIQENGRFAAYIIRNSVEHAGLIGCAKFTNFFPIYNYGVGALNKINLANYFMVYKGKDNVWQPAIPQIFKIRPKPDTDVIVVRGMAAMTTRLIQSVNNDVNLYVGLNPKFNKKDDVMIADCSHAVLAHLKSTYQSIAKKRQRLTATQTIKQEFAADAEVGEMQTRVFYINDTKRKNKKGEKIYALYQVDERGRKAELISNVIDMKIFCYELRQGNVVQVVKIKLLLVSQDDVLAKAKNIILIIKYFIQKIEDYIKLFSLLLF